MWDFLLEVLDAFGFGPRWCSWIRGIFSSNMSSILVHRLVYNEDAQSFCWLKQGGPLVLSFYLVMFCGESLHLSVCRAVNDGIFKGLQLQDHMTLSHLFYADDVVFVGEWSDSNLANLIKILKCLFASGLKDQYSKSRGQCVLCFVYIYKVPLGVLQDLERIRRPYSLNGFGVIYLRGILMVTHILELVVMVDSELSTKFWLDFWVSNMALCDRFPRIFALETVKEVLVADKMEVSPLCTSFRRPIRDGVERSVVVVSAMLCFGYFNPCRGQDGRVILMAKVRFVSKIFGYSLMIFISLLGCRNEVVKHVPIKVNVFAWRARLDRLPTRLNLSKRGILTNSIACPICDSGLRSGNHFHFVVARLVRIFCL
ncbi:RNA-directed DNA polymerase, eukaryota [Tanacetum coccineum]